MVVSGYNSGGVAPQFEDLASLKATMRSKCDTLNEFRVKRTQIGTAGAVELEMAGGLTITDPTKAGQTWVAQISAYAEDVILTLVWEDLAGTQTTSTLTLTDANETAFDPAITTGYKAISGSLSVENPNGVTVKVGVTGMATPVLIIAAGTSTTNLLTALTGTSIETAVQAGYHECGLTGKTGATETGLAPQKTYAFKIAIDGGSVTEYYFPTNTAAVTFDALIALLHASKKVADDTVFSGAVFSIEGGDLRCTSALRTATSAIAITAGTTAPHTDLLGALTGFTSVDTAVETAYMECGLTGKSASTDTGLTPNAYYSFKVNLQGAGAVEYYITTNTVAVTYGALITLLNAAKKVSDDTAISGCTFTLTGGDIRCTSSNTGATSAVALTAGDSEGYINLLGASGLNCTPDAAAYLAYQECGLTDKVSENLTGLVASSQYYFKVAIDGAAAGEYNITTGTDLSFTTIVGLMNTAMGEDDATWSLTGGDLRCTSDAVTDAAAIALTAGTTGDDLFAQLTGFSDFETAVIIGHQEFGLSGKTEGGATGLTAVQRYYYKINIDGAGLNEEYIDVTAGSTLFSDIITLLNAGISGATFAISGGDLRCTSDATTSSAAIALSEATLTGTPLFTDGITGFSAFEAAVHIGHQEFGLSGKTGSSATGLSAVQRYYFKRNIDGAGAAEKYIDAVAGSTTYTSILVLLNAAIDGDAEFSLTGGDLRCTSTSGAITAGVVLTAGTSGTDFFGELTGFTDFETALYAEYQEFGLTGKVATALATGLAASTTYYYKLALNGGDVTEYYITTYGNIPTFGELINLLNLSKKVSDDTAITGVTFSLTSGDIRCTSASVLSTTSVAITGGQAVATAVNLGGEGALYVYEETDTEADRGKVVCGEYVTSAFTRKYFMGTLNETNSTTVSHCLEATYVAGVLTASTTYVNDFYRRGKWMRFEQVAGKYIAIGSYAKTHWGVIEEGTDVSHHSRFTVLTGSRAFFAGYKASANTAAIDVTITYTEYGSAVPKTYPMPQIPSSGIVMEDWHPIELAANSDFKITILGNASVLTMEAVIIEMINPHTFTTAS
jgi:hypothetical protein